MVREGRSMYTRVIDTTIQPVSGQWVPQSSNLSKCLLLEFQNLHFVVRGQ